MTPTPDAAPPAAGVVDRAGEVLAAHERMTPSHIGSWTYFCACRKWRGNFASGHHAHVAEALAAAGLLAGGADAVAALADEWQRDLDSGGIRDAEARYCWSTALRELRAALGADR